MPFGKKIAIPCKPHRISQPIKPVKASPKFVLSDGVVEESNARIFVLLSMIVLFAGLIYIAPHTYSTRVKTYKPEQIIQAVMAARTGNPERIKSVEEDFNLDYSRILTTVRAEETLAMKTVARECLPNPSPHPLVLPHKAHGYYSRAKTYLRCVMTHNVERFCDPVERKRLVEQLTQFRKRRAEIISLEAAKDSIDLTGLQGHRLSTSKALKNTRWSTPPGKNNLDPTLGAALANLVERGYLSPSDFGYFGLYLPAEFAPYLDLPRKTSPNCQ